MLAMYQVVSGTTATMVGVVPPGGAAVFQPPPSGSSAVAIGVGTLVTTTNGFPLYAGGAPVFINMPITSAPATIYAISTSTTAAIGVAFINGS
jgi:hypothetical protein